NPVVTAEGRGRQYSIRRSRRCADVPKEVRTSSAIVSGHNLNFLVRLASVIKLFISSCRFQISATLTLVAPIGLILHHCYSSNPDMRLARHRSTDGWPDALPVFARTHD